MGIKQYMSRYERTEFVTFNTLLGYAKAEFLPKWSANKVLTQEESDKTTEALKLLAEVKDSILLRMDKDYRSILERDSKNLQIITLPKDKADITLKRYKESDELVTVDRIVIDFLASVSLELCSQCYKNLDEQKECALKVCYIEARLDVFNPEVEEGGCPFKMDEVNVNNEFLRDFVKKLFKQIKDKGGKILVTDTDTYSNDTSLKSLEG